MKINHTDSRIRYTGRINDAEDGARFYWPGSFAQVRFTGTTLRCTVTPWLVWGTVCLGLIVDGRLSRVPLNRDMDRKPTEFILADNLEPGMLHTVTLFKQLDCSYSYRLLGFETDGEFAESAPRESLRLEFYGDSVTAGACVEAVDYVGRTDPCSNDAVYDNAWWSYAWQTARMLNAECHLTAQGGIAVLPHTGYFHYPTQIGMNETWDRLCYFPEGGEFTKWDFSRFIPHAVVFALGQNDHHNALTEQDDLRCEGEHKDLWKAEYKKIAKGVLAHYPAGTPAVFITTLIRHEREWDEAIGEIAEELRAEGFHAHQYLFRRNGDGTDGHPRIPEQTEMAEELAAFLKTVL
ncbi:MAG: hypothetical protein IJK29_11710 [Bacteroidales bacterium]|nr:hypothetical protein [Bacteroidales bacterium]MBQ6177857.1 hypothetical protein [Bacteroidales bacterium]